MTDPRHDADKTGAAAARGSTLLITNLTKLAGVYLAIHEQAAPGPAQNSVMAVAALFVLGAQFAENGLMRLIDRFFGG